MSERVHVPDVALTQLLYDAANDFPRRKALVFLGRTMTYQALVNAVDQFAGALHDLGVRKGDRVALILPNCPQNVIAFFAVLQLGAVVVQHNPLYTTPELEHQLADSGATVAIVYDGAYGRLADARPATALQHVIVTSLADYLPSGKRLALRLPFDSVREKREQLVAELPADADVLRFGELLDASSGPVRQVMITPETDLALLQYTGGTTGMPKGAMLTHRNLVANAYQATAWDPDMERGRETVLAVLPMFHVYGLTMCLTMNMLAAGTLVLLPTFDLGLLFKAIDKWKPTVFPGVPPMYDQIVRSRRTGKHDLRSIRTCVSGAMRLPPETVEKFEQVTGGRLVEGYGLTESSPVATANPLNENARPGTIGVAVPGTDIRIADLEDASRDVSFGIAGELCIRGPQVFAGYWQQPEETATMLHDGWLHTGDIAVMDEQGFVTIVDRKRDVINASGFSIFPSEVEDVLVEHPAVQACAVAGVSHYYRGETVKAFVVLEPDQRVTEEELHDFCSARLVAYKVPARFEFRADLPRNILGKVLRRVLRAEDEAARTGDTLPQAGYVDVTPSTIDTGEFGPPMYIGGLDGLSQHNGAAANGVPAGFGLPQPNGLPGPNGLPDSPRSGPLDAVPAPEPLVVHNDANGTPAANGGPFDDAPAGLGWPLEHGPAANGGPLEHGPAANGGPLDAVLAPEPVVVHGDANGTPAGNGGPFDHGAAPNGGPVEHKHAANGGPLDHGAAPNDSLVDALERLSRLHDVGALTDDEFHAAKARLLG